MKLEIFWEATAKLYRNALRRYRDETHA